MRSSSSSNKSSNSSGIKAAATATATHSEAYLGTVVGGRRGDSDFCSRGEEEGRQKSFLWARKFSKFFFKRAFLKLFCGFLIT